jgi:hypothetical protein
MEIKKKRVHPDKMLNKMNIAINYVYNAFFISSTIFVSYKNSKTNL